jgi:hypothetical protein
MNAAAIPLSMVKIASPCTASWGAMTGDERARFCSQCSQHVYNFSTMTEAEIHALIKEKEGKLCARFYQRADGTMMTADCPAGTWRRRALAVAMAMTMFIVIVVVLPLGVMDWARSGSVDGEQAFNPIQRVKNWLFPPTPPRCVMGKM